MRLLLLSGFILGLSTQTAQAGGHDRLANACMVSLDALGTLSPGSFYNDFVYPGSPASLLFNESANQIYVLSDRGLGSAKMGEPQKTRKQTIQSGGQTIEAMQKFTGFQFQVPGLFGKSTPQFALTIVKYKNGALFEGQRQVPELPDSRFTGGKADLKTRSVTFRSSIITAAPDAETLRRLGYNNPNSIFRDMNYPLTEVQWKLEGQELLAAKQAVQDEFQNRIYTLESALRAAIEGGATREELAHSPYEDLANAPEIMRSIRAKCFKSATFTASAENAASLRTSLELYEKLRKLFGKR